jgi:endonuclease YncB( thermonuclease family)
MKKAIPFLLLLMLSGSIVQAAESFGYLHSIQYVNTLTAKSFVVDIPGQHPLIGKKIEIVIKGIEVPDQRGVCRQERERADKAVQLVDFLLSRAKKISLKNVERGRLFRLVATVLVDGKDIRDVLVKTGYAVFDSGGKGAVDWCR